MDFKKLLFLLISLVGFSLISKGQSETNKDSQWWNAVIMDWEFTNNWLFEFEFDYNTLISGSPDFNEIAIQPSFEYYPNSRIDLFAGTYLSIVEQNDDQQTKELRPLAGFRWNIIRPDNRVFLRLQEKLEYRLFNNSDNSNNQSGRLRSRLDLFIPIIKKSYPEDQNLYAKIWFEVFTNFDKNIDERFRSSIRLYTGLGYRFNYNYRLELDYVLQESRDSINDQFDDNISNVIFITFKRYFAKKSDD